MEITNAIPVNAAMLPEYSGQTALPLYLAPANDSYPELDVTDQDDIVLWGVLRTLSINSAAKA